ADHRVWTENRGDVPAAALTKDDVVRLVTPRFGREAIAPEVAEYVGLMLGDGCVSHGIATLAMDRDTERLIAEKAAEVVNGFSRRTHREGVHVTERSTSVAVASAAAEVRELLAAYAVLDEGSARKRLTAKALQLTEEAVAALLRG